MESHRPKMESHRKINSDELPSEFEFGTLTPSSPSQDSLAENSPADHLFLNGRLLPHFFPAASTKRSFSLTTSEYTSRCNSVNSRSSICSNSSSTSISPRTSSFGNSSPINHNKPLDLKLSIKACDKSVYTTNKSSYLLPQDKREKATERVRACLYRSYSSQRWQYITPVRVKMSGGIKVGGRRKKVARMRKKAEERRGSRVMKWWRRILMAAIFACRECHALEEA